MSRKKNEDIQADRTLIDEVLNGDKAEPQIEPNTSEFIFHDYSPAEILQRHTLPSIGKKVDRINSDGNVYTGTIKDAYSLPDGFEGVVIEWPSGGTSDVTFDELINSGAELRPHAEPVSETPTEISTVAETPDTPIADAVVVPNKVNALTTTVVAKPSRAEAEDAVRVLLRWAGDDPVREGLIDTPSRVVRSYDEFFTGYDADPHEILERTFEETDGYDEMILLRDIRFESHCEHHMAPIIGKAHIGYLPHKRVVGISKLARVVEIYAKRLQIQEKMTAQIANIINDVLQPRGVAVVIEASHQCMTTRGVHKPGVTMVTSRMLGGFRTDPSTRREFLAIIGRPATIETGNV